MMTFESRRNEVISAMGGSRYCDFSDSVRRNAVSEKIRDYAKARALDMDRDEVAALAEATDGYLMRLYPTLPLKEVETALDWEMLTGEAIRITPRAMLKGVEKYLNSDERKAAFAQARRDRTGERTPLTEAEVRLADFDALREALLAAWEGYRIGGALEPYRIAKGEASADGWRGAARDALRISQRHIYAGCYAWLKTYGAVADDEETKRRERVCLSNARKEGAAAVPVYAEALMLEWVFSEAVKRGDNLCMEINKAAGLTTEVVRMNTPLKRITN